MDQLSYRRHRFPPPIIQHAIWFYLRLTLSYRDVEELLAERGLEVSYETVRRGGLKFGPGIARKLRRCRPRPQTGRVGAGPLGAGQCPVLYFRGGSGMREIIRRRRAPAILNSLMIVSRERGAATR